MVQLCGSQKISILAILIIAEIHKQFLIALIFSEFITPHVMLSITEVKTQTIAIDFKIPKEKTSSSFLIVIYSLSEFSSMGIRPSDDVLQTTGPGTNI